MNNVTLVGRLTKDPELRYTPAGTAVSTSTIAVDREFTKEKETDFINIVIWGKLGEIVAEKCRKGKEVGIVGRIQTRNYENAEGKRVYVTEVVAEKVKFLRDPAAHGDIHQGARETNLQSPFDM